ncbi:meiosis-specific kinetochore protein [Trichosurus vulpecula]|uniref:meiosis-specific kinetochore protein n=1 Tax=Trichosurus vulpecula TaxID=9337 RepID=UPI00186AC1C8|nr:meiosis-specific kinetochore protein [Trichosurus vulpecula]
MWPQRIYVQRPRRPRRRLNHTPPPPGPSLGLPEPQTRYAPIRGSKGKLPVEILPKLKENVEATQLHESPATNPGMQLNVAHQKKLQKSHVNEDSKNMTPAQKESLTDDDLQGESNPNNTQISSGVTLSSDIFSSLLRSSDMNFCMETTSLEDSLSSFLSPEVFRGGEFLDIHHSTTEDYLKLKNSTFLDTSRAVAIENMQQFSNLSAILDNSICKILPEIEETLDVKTEQTNPSVPVGKKNREFLTSSPSSETGRFEINLSPVQKLSSEGELNQNTSNYIYSDEIVPASSSEEEKDSWEARCITSEMCCIITSPPRNRSTEMLYCCPKGWSKVVRNEPMDKERFKTRGRTNTIERINMQCREEQTNSSVTIGEKNMELLGSSLSTEIGRFETPCLLSETCCIVKKSPQIRCTKMPVSLPKGMSKDMDKKQVDKKKLKTKGMVDAIEGTSNQCREEVMESRAQVERVVTAKVSCVTSEICCIVKASPRITCCPCKRMPKDIIMTDECAG